MSNKNSYPHLQPFNVGGRRNLTKKNSWWATPPFHNNAAQKVGKK